LQPYYASIWLENLHFEGVARPAFEAHLGGGGATPPPNNQTYQVYVDFALRNVLIDGAIGT
jgi:hypothetical protein